MNEALEDHAAARVSGDETDRDLVARFQAGDESAFDQIVELHERRVTRLVYRLLGWSHEIEDLVQDVFVSVFVNLHRFRRDSKFTTWLTSVAVNRCRSHQRDVHGAIDYYGQALDSATDEELRVSYERDNWLLISLKKDRTLSRNKPAKGA